MNYEILSTEYFDRQAKQLSKKYHSFTDDLESLKKELKKNPTMGDEISGTIRKVRMAIASKNKGKRAGARVITYGLLIDVENTKIYLLTIYDKSNQESISKEEIKILRSLCQLINN